MAAKIEIKIPAIPVLWIVIFGFLPIEAILLSMFSSHPPWRETIVFGATIVGGAFALYSHLKHIDENREKYAHELIERWNSPNPELEMWKDTLRTAFAGILDPRTLIRTKSLTGAIELPKTADLIASRNRLVGLLSYCEEVALGVRTHTADEDIVRRLLENVLIMCWTTFKPWIEGERATLGTLGNDLYIELQRVIEKWGG